VTSHFRFAPSPTGYLHLGNIRTALVNWLFARKTGGRFLLRIDDTDLERSEERYTQAIQEDLRWLGLTWDAMEHQSARMDSYAKAKEQLLAMGRLYPCYETKDELEIKRKFQLSRGEPPIYDRASRKLSDAQIQAYEAEGRVPHWRFLLNDAEVVWEDLIRGKVAFDGRSMSDPILFREDGQPTYTHSSVVDDGELGITHIIRGEDHVSNTAVQVQLFEALFGGAPAFAHLALMRGKTGEMSKREGGFDIRSLRDQGIEPMAICSLLARIGTSQAIEPFAELSSLVEGFDIGSFGRAPTTYDPDDLQRLNGKILGSTSFALVAPRLAAMGLAEVSEAFWYAVRGNIAQLADLRQWWDLCHGNITATIAEEDLAFVQDAATHLPPEPWDATTWQVWTEALKQATGRKGKGLFLPLRQALTGLDHGPELAVLLPLMGARVARERLAA
jgi:glutamyl-tRNA synthetase